MRPASRALLALALALPAGAAQAQVQQNDPNAANASFALQGQIRALNQQRVSDFNTLNQTIQRNVQFALDEQRKNTPESQVVNLPVKKKLVFFSN